MRCPALRHNSGLLWVPHRCLPTWIHCTATGSVNSTEQCSERMKGAILRILLFWNKPEGTTLSQVGTAHFATHVMPAAPISYVGLCRGGCPREEQLRIIPYEYSYACSSASRQLGCKHEI
jgi:hypothetical protein